MAQNVVAVVLLVINLLDNLVEALWRGSSTACTIFQRTDRQTLAQQ
jgi:hypothetical protein